MATTTSPLGTRYQSLGVWLRSWLLRDLGVICSLLRQQAVLIGHSALGVREVVLHADLAEFLRLATVRHLHNILYQRPVLNPSRRDLGEDLVFSSLEFHFTADGPVLLAGADATDVVSGLAALLLEHEMEIEPVLASKALEVAIIELG